MFIFTNPFQKLSLKENCSYCRFAASGAVHVYRPEQKVVIGAILFRLITICKGLTLYTLYTIFYSLSTLFLNLYIKTEKN